MTILVTEGAGFIGSTVIRHIIRDTANSVINLDRLTYAGNLGYLAEASESQRYAFEQLDICDRAEVERVFRDHQLDADYWQGLDKARKSALAPFHKEAI